MEKINYPLIGLVVVEADHEENYIFTEAEFERVSFPRARKIILSDELKLTGFIHGRRGAGNPDFLSRGRNAQFSGVFSF